jgi:hypothetical protein
MAESRKIYTDQAYQANFDGVPANSPIDFKGLGYYSRTSVEDIVNNFVVAYIGEDKVLTKVPEFEVAFWAQRGLQEFSYDILHSEKSIELELGPSLQVPLPQDFVSYKGVYVITNNGSKKLILPNKSASNAATAVLQDSDFKYLYNSNGSVQSAGNSEAIGKFQSPSDQGQSATEYYNNNYNQDNFSYYNSRYGSNPADMNLEGGYFLDTSRGIIFFDGTFANQELIIVLEYISDGLADNGDLSKVYIPKFAEDALYAYMLYNLSKLRPSTASLAPFYKKEASAKMRNTKIRLSNYKSEEMTQVLRGKSKWIKH